jgi:predicted RNA-binding protein with PUA-like domain
MAKYWLMKSEPEIYSIDDLARDGRTEWDGVRNYQARNYMRDEMSVGDLVLFYHSSADPPGVAGLAKVSSKAHPDETQFDRRSPYYDASALRDDPRWWLVDVAFVERFDPMVTLEALKARSDRLDGMMVIKRGVRFSVQPVDRAHFRCVLSMAGARTKVR